MTRRIVTTAITAFVLCISVSASAQTDTPARQRAYTLFRAITGVGISIDDARIIQMENLIAAGDEKGAAAVATSDPLFYDVRLRDMAKIMSNRAESVNVPLNDFVATWVGAIRDNVDARQLLTGNFYYTGNPALATAANPVRSDVNNDILTSDNHYTDLEEKNYSLFANLVRVDGQQISVNSVPAPLVDAAGLITTRAFMAAHALDGTNRRLVEYTFREFECTPILNWMDATRPDTFIGRDVDRFPGGDDQRFQTTCKACHSQMDAIRPAFAFFDWDDNNGKILQQTSPFGKLNKNNTVFPQGFAVNNNNWVNLATAPKNEDQFGWRGTLMGTGLNTFAGMIANSKGFSRCMVKRFFQSICKRDPNASEKSALESVAVDFETDYQLKRLAGSIATNPLCLVGGGV